MKTRLLSHPFFLPAAVAVLAASAGCALMEPAMEPAPRRPPQVDQPDRDGDAVMDGQEDAEPVVVDERAHHATGSTTTVATPTPATGSETRSAQNKKTVVDFSDATVEGELTRPDGTYVETKQKAKFKDLVAVPTVLGHKGKEESDDFDKTFGDEGGKRGKKGETEGYLTPDGKLHAYVPPPAKPEEISVLKNSGRVPGPQPVGQPIVPPVGVVANGKIGADPTVVKPPPEKPREPESNPNDLLRHYGVNPTIETSDERFSTFSADVDTGSYTIARSYLERGSMPPEAAVRVEEVVNAFDYGYRAPEKEAFAVQVEAFPSPNRKGYHVLHLGLKGREISAAARKPASLVFTIDISGSMEAPNRLSLAKRALDLLLGQLDERDQVSIVVYGDNARVALPPTNAAQKDRIAAAIHELRAEGSTNVQAGLELAYTTALRAFKPDGVNRVILLSDGVANNGITNADGIFAKVKARASEGITLTTVGFGMGEYNDVLMERLADQGDGQYAYVDKLEEARRIFVEQLTGTLQVIAKDVKLQLEFNPEAVARYRLLGFENRALTREDFHNDKKDAGELGAGHAVTAIYEVKFRSRAPQFFATFRARYKEPRAVTSGLVEKPLPMTLVKDSVGASSGPARLSLVAAGFAEKLRGSYWARNLEWGELAELWDTLPDGLKSKPRVQELRALLLKAKSLDRRPDRFERDMPVASMDFDRVPVLR